MKGPKRRVRAEGSLVSVMVLIGTSVLMGTIVLFWGQGLIGQSRSDFGSNILRSNMQASEGFNIDNVFFGTGTVRLYVRNFSDVPVRIKAVYILDTQTGTLLNSNPELSSTLVVLPRATSSVSVSLDTSAYTGKTLTIRITSDLGNGYQENFTVG